ncbi:aminotransferase class III-fold pyridoxal phosphate-dependent enzyme, partial [Mycobacterium tuberculosis]|nr:aminotransferase class III-fold pyridoxal phosphate-dependent enzyme [Mycobacterium tuberculosis]
RAAGAGGVGGAGGTGLGGGFPVGACLATEEAASGMVPGVHGTTFGGNLLAMAVGNAVVEEIGKPEFLEDVRAKSRRMKQKLAGLVDTHPDVFEGVRGEGLLLGVKCK